MYRKLLILSLIAVSTLTAYAQPEPSDKLLLLNEGSWQTDNGRLTLIDNNRVVSNQWFRDVNGIKLGDTPHDIVEVRDGVIAITVSTSNIIQFIDYNGKSLAAVEGVPFCYDLASDGNYLYVSSYAHECTTVSGKKTYEKGFVAKIDSRSFEVVDAVEVGYEPCGLACYNGYVFVANSGGYASMEEHEYESTISMIDATIMEVTRVIETGQKNLSGQLGQSGKYLCVGSPGDYYEIAGATIVLDCEKAVAGEPDAECFVKLNHCSSTCTVDRKGKFLSIGSSYSFDLGGYVFNFLTIDPEQVMATRGTQGFSTSLPGNISGQISKKITMPYGIYCSPYTGYIYVSDARDYISNGKLYQWDAEGQLLHTYNTAINPSRALAIDPAKVGVAETFIDPRSDDDTIYDLNGLPVVNPIPGHIYIRSGRKYIHH